MWRLFETTTLGLAILSTVAADHTKDLVAGGDGLTSALLGGYHVAFIVGALAIGAGIALAFVLLRPRDPEPQLAEAPVEHAPAPVRFAMEEQAA